MFSRHSASVFHIITGLNDGGAEGVLYRLCIFKSGYRHHVISLMGEGKYGPLLLKHDVSVTCLNMQRGRISFSGLLRLCWLLLEERPQVVQTWMYHADIIGGVTARLVGVPNVFWGIRHTTLDVKHSRWSTILVAKLCAWLSFSIPAGIVCCAQTAAAVHRGLGYQANKLHVIPNGYDLERLTRDQQARADLKKEWGVPSELPLLGMVGRFDAQKDHQNLLVALNDLKKQGVRFRCAFVGRGLESANPRLDAWLSEYDLKDEILLLGPRTDIPAVMSALDIHVLSSAFGEAFPNVLAEAMACGTPCVTTDVGDAALIVGRTGWVVPPGDATALADAILAALAESAAKRESRGEAARNRIEANFSLSRMARGYHAIWSKHSDTATVIH